MSTNRFALLVALLAALVAATSFAIAYRSFDDDGVAPPPAPSQDSPTPSVTEAPTPTATSTTAPLTEPGGLHPPTWVVIVASGSSRTEADSAARRLAAAGYPAGVLHSDDYSSLSKGLWVAYAGPYPSSPAAQAVVPRLTADGFSGSYPRCVGDKKDCESPKD